MTERRRFGRYEITGILGRGGMATVYRAHDTLLRRDVALKVLYPQYVDDPADIERFRREATTAASLDHPGVVPIYDIGEEAGATYIAMRLIVGRSLAEVLRARDTIPTAELLPIIVQVAAALDAAHARGIVHRDVKPANVLLQDEPDAPPRALITDFGIAKALDAPGLTRTGILIGTPDYMAPEQIGGGVVDGRADIYALGALTYRCLTGQRLYPGGAQEVLLGHLRGDAPAASAANPQLPPALDAILARALARDPAARYPTAGAFAADLVRATAAAHGDNPVRPQHSPSADQRSGMLRPYDPAAPRPADPPTPRATASPLLWRTIPVIIAIVGIVIAGGGLLYAMNLYFAAPPPVAIIATATPTTTATSPLTPTIATPTIATSTSTPSLAPSAEPSALPTRTVLLPTPSATLQPTPEPSVTPPPTATRALPTATLPPPATATLAPAPPTETPVPPTTTEIPAATATPTALPTTTTPTSTATVPLTPTPCPVAAVGGFRLLRLQNPAVNERMGCPLAIERGGPAELAEQPFERGMMLFSASRNVTYALYGRGSGAWQSFNQADLIDLPTPTPEIATDERVVPVRGFGLVWGTQAGVKDKLGYATRDEAGPLEGVLQSYEGGLMIYSRAGVGRGPTLYVLYADGSFERYDDPNAP